ncbi:hypothetical protein BJ741DRAFT_596400 [Chytriomyces cf. hyalinus JEL632]|nr:hypothetical protein BJ741DRAFT_596400 [Chytriomyces cf. hyalinus JEL632]
MVVSSTPSTSSTATATASPRPLPVQQRIRKQSLATTLAVCICLALLLLAARVSTRFLDSQATLPEFGLRIPATSVRRLSIESIGSLGHLTIQVLQGTGQQATFALQIQSDDMLQVDASKVLLVNQNSDGFVRIEVKFPDTEWLPIFRARHHFTLYVNTPLDMTTFAVTGHFVNVMYMGPNVSETLSVKVERGSVKLATPLSTKAMDIETGEGSIVLARELFISDSVRLKTRVGEIQGLLNGFKTLLATSESGDFELVMRPGVRNAVIILILGTGNLYAEVDHFQGKMNMDYDPVRRKISVGGAVHWPPISTLPFASWVNGVGVGQGVCNMTIEGSGSILVQFPTILSNNTANIIA